MLLSQTSRYALGATAYMAERHEEDRAVPVGEIADAIGVPRNYLSKTLHQLARQGVLTSERGPKGGFRLARNPAHVRLFDVVGPLDPSFAEHGCLLGLPSCSDANPCAAYERWRDLADHMSHFLESTHLIDLTRTV